jgi:hypothetical protein
MRKSFQYIINTVIRGAVSAPFFMSVAHMAVNNSLHNVFLDEMRTCIFVIILQLIGEINILL